MSRFWKSARNAGVGLTSLVMASVPAFGQSEPDTLSGVISRPDMTPLDSAAVSILDWVPTPLSSDTTDANGFFEAIGARPSVSNEDDSYDSGFKLRSPYPNPFNEATNLDLNLPRSSDVSVEVFDLLGRSVYQDSQSLSSGAHSLNIDIGSDVADGPYFVRVMADDHVASKKLIHHSGATRGQPSAPAPFDLQSFSRGGGDDITVRIERTGYITLEVEVPEDAEVLNQTLQYDENFQDFAVVDDDGGFVAGADVAYDFDRDGDFDLVEQTNSAGQGSASAFYRGLADVQVSHPSLETTIFETFFGGGNATFVADNKSLFHEYFITDVNSNPVEGVAVDGSCEINGNDYSISSVSNAQGIAPVLVDLEANLRGGEYLADCDLDFAKNTFVSESRSENLVDGGSSNLVLDRLGFVELYALPLLDHFGSVGPGFMEIGADVVFDADGNLLPDGRVPLDDDGAARFYVTQGDFTVDSQTANHNGGLVVWNRPPGIIDHYANGREGHRMYDKIVRVGGPGTNSSDVFTAYIANDDWQADEDGMAMFLRRLAGNNWEDFPLRCYNIYENGLPYAAFSTEDVDGTVYVPLAENINAARAGLDTLAAMYESRTSIEIDVRQVPLDEYTDQTFGITAFDLAPPGQNSSSIDPNTGLILAPTWISPAQFVVLPSGSLDENIDAILGPDFGQVFAISGPNGQIIIPDDIANQLFASFTYGCMENAYDG